MDEGQVHVQPMESVSQIKNLKKKSLVSYPQKKKQSLFKRRKELQVLNLRKNPSKLREP